MNIEELVRTHGYWMVALGTLLEGDATVITAAFLAHRGYLSLGWICCIAGFATTAQNLVLYELARRRGSFFEGSGRTAHQIERLLGWVRTRGAVVLLASRFLLGVRSAAALACGVAKMPRQLFFWSNLVGAAVWTAVMAAAGYSGGHLFTVLVDDVKRHEWWVAAALGAAVTVGVLWKTRAAEVVDLVGSAGLIQGWAKSEWAKRRNHSGHIHSDGV